MRLLTIITAAILIAGCGAQSSDFARTDFKAHIEADAKAIGKTAKNSQGYRGSACNHQWDITFVADEQNAHKIFAAHKARVVDAMQKEGLQVNGSGSGGGGRTVDFDFSYKSPSGHSVIHSFLVRHPEDHWSIIQIVHEPSGS